MSVQGKNHIMRALSIFVILTGFLVGYNAVYSQVQYCAAQPLPVVPATPVIGGMCVCCKGCTSPCDPSGTASNIRSSLVNTLENALKQSAQTVERYMSAAIDTMVNSILERINQMELDFISWWQTMWYYNLQPAMKAEARQLGVAMTDQSRTFQGAIDGVEITETKLKMQEQEVKAVRAFPSPEQVCVVATQAGGLGRANKFSREIKKAWATRAKNRGLNIAGTSGAKSRAGQEAERYQEVQNVFCDPDDNGGVNTCAAADPAYYNADVLASRTLFNKLTINIDAAPEEEQSVDALITNLVGSPAAEPIPDRILKTPGGMQTFMDRRAFMARHNAVRSVPQLLAGWRTPGSGMGNWVKELRQNAGVPLADISANPSYREIVHAVAVDRFNSGKYATDMIADQAALDMEKLTIAAFHLMQLRDYYELLERTALALAIQVSVMADNEPMPPVEAYRPQR